MPISKIESRGTFTLSAPETVRGKMPTNARWQVLDLNSYSDAGATYDSTARSVMSGDRQRRKGSQMSKEVAFGYNIDLTQNNVASQICAFLFGKPVEKGTNRSIVDGSPLTTLAYTPITAMTSTTITVAGADTYLAVKDIIILRDGVNDRVPLLVSAVSSTVVTFAPLLVNTSLVFVGQRPAPRIIKVGVQTAANDLKLTGFADRVELSSTALNFVNQRLSVGEWLFVGGDVSTSKFAGTDAFYGRISAITANKITLDTTNVAVPIGLDPTTTSVTELYFGTFVCDGETMASYTHSRYLGKNDAGKNMREVFTGCMPSELALSLSEQDKANIDLTYLALDKQNTALTDAEQTAAYATVLPEHGEESYNLSTDIVRQRMAIQKAGVMNPSAIHSFVQEANISITNNLSGDTGIGWLGAFDATAGDFELSGTLTAYFVSLDAVEAIKCNCTVGMDIILAHSNSGMVFDIPAFTLGGGGINVEKGQSIKLDLEQAAFKSKFGFTIGYTLFPYLPTAAMPPALSSCAC